jgi:hypothetical protein
VKGPFVQLESPTKDVEEDEVLEVFVDETDEELLLVEVVLTLLVNKVLVDDDVVDFFVEGDVVVFLTARAERGASSMTRPFFSPITAADAARLEDKRVQRPNLEINIL